MEINSSFKNDGNSDKTYFEYEKVSKLAERWLT